MKQISKVFLACACSLSGLTTQAQDQTVWSNDFSNASQPLNTVGRLSGERRSISFAQRLCPFRQS